MTSVQCPRCGTRRETNAQSIDLCPVCLLTTALSTEEAPCPYRIVSPIDQDARGTTYLAQPLTGTHRYVALKIFGPQEDVDAILSRYERWKPALDHISRPSANCLKHAGLTADGCLFTVSDYVAGWPLTATAPRESLSGEARDEIARQLAGALESAHGAGVFHLGLGPAKVKISTANGPSATILGFGYALILDGAEGARETDLAGLSAILRNLKQPDALPRL